jgi:hypothetical protein
MSKNKYLEIYNDIFPGTNENNELKVKKSYDLNWITCRAYNSNDEIKSTKESIINLIDSDYVIFPTNKFYHFHLKGSGIFYLRKTKTVCINYYLKSTITWWI